MDLSVYCECSHKNVHRFCVCFRWYYYLPTNINIKSWTMNDGHGVKKLKFGSFVQKSNNYYFYLCICFMRGWQRQFTFIKQCDKHWYSYNVSISYFIQYVLCWAEVIFDLFVHETVSKMKYFRLIKVTCGLSLSLTHTRKKKSIIF